MTNDDIPPKDVPLISHALVSADPPELTTTPEFRALMLKTRKRIGMSQAQLAARVGTSQNIISMIESGGIERSGFILKICKTLSISPPQHHGDELERHWVELGHRLRTRNQKAFERALAFIGAMIDEDDEA